jgi:predicted metal-dependent hydrolase
LPAASRSSPRKGSAAAGADPVDSAEGGIVYSLVRSRRRTVGISVHPDGTVVVRAPLRATREAIRRFVGEKAGWIEAARRRMAARPPEPAPPGYESGEPHRFLGRPCRLVVSRGRSDAVELLVGCLCVTVSGEPSPPRVKALLEGWYRERAGTVFAERLAFWRARMAGERIPDPELRIRRMTSRWGSCSVGAGRVNLNLWLVREPVELIDYVVVHELCHFKVKSHGPGFWALVARFLPDWADRRRRLNAGGA